MFCFSLQDLLGSSTLPPALSGLDLPPRWQDFISEFDVSSFCGISTAIQFFSFGRLFLFKMTSIQGTHFMSDFSFYFPCESNP